MKDFFLNLKIGLKVYPSFFYDNNLPSEEKRKRRKKRFNFL
jgi:hypothetical protein